MTTEKRTELNDFLSQTINFFQFGKEQSRTFLLKAYSDEFIDKAVIDGYLIEKKGYADRYYRYNEKLRPYVG